MSNRSLSLQQVAASPDAAASAPALDQIDVDRQVRKVYRVYYLIRALHIFAQSACLSILVIYAQTFLGDGPHKVLGLQLTKSQLVLLLVLSNYFCEALLELLTGQYADRSGRANAVKAYSGCYFLSAICCAAVIFY